MHHETRGGKNWTKGRLKLNIIVELTRSLFMHNFEQKHSHVRLSACIQTCVCVGRGGLGKKCGLGLYAWLARFPKKKKKWYPISLRSDFSQNKSAIEQNFEHSQTKLDDPPMLRTIKIICKHHINTHIDSCAKSLCAIFVFIQVNTSVWGFLAIMEV